MATISDADMAEALEARRRAWSVLGMSGLTLSQMSPEGRARADQASAVFRWAVETLVAGVRQRGGSWTAPAGETLHLNRDGDGILWECRDLDAGDRKWLAAMIRQIDAINVRRLAAPRAASVEDGRRAQSTEDRA